MTKEQEEAIGIISKYLNFNEICGTRNFKEAIETVLSMLKEKNEQIVKYEKIYKEYDCYRWVKELDKKDRQIDLMANYIVNLIKYNNPEEIREVEELKQYFERKSEK